MRASIRAMSETALSISPRGHKANARQRHRGHAFIQSKTKGQVVISARLEQIELLVPDDRALRRILPRQWCVTPQMRCAMPASGESGPRLDLAEEVLRAAPSFATARPE